jgi:hypothetical protein
MKYLVVTGIYRSGTSLLQKVLDAHPQVEILYQPSLPYFKHMQRSGLTTASNGDAIDPPLGIEFRPGDIDDRGALGALSISDDNIRGILDSLRALYRAERDAGFSDSPPQEFVDCLEEKIEPGKASDVFRAFIEAIRTYRGADPSALVGFKELFIEEFIGNLIAVFGSDLGVIHIVRDPRAVLASRNHSDLTKKLGLRHPILFVARMWRTSVQYRQHWATVHPRSVLGVRFETLVNQREDMVSELCRFIGIKPDAAMFDESSYRHEDGSPWRSTTGHGRLKTASDAVDIWRTVLPREDQGVIEYLCQEQMIREGYTPELTEADQRQYLAEYEENPSAFKPWTRQVGLLLDSTQRQLEINSKSNP